MPWLETAPMEQRERFIRDHQLALYTMVELSARYGISRKTGYKVQTGYIGNRLNREHG
jgi:putative transposase